MPLLLRLLIQHGGPYVLIYLAAATRACYTKNSMGVSPVLYAGQGFFPMELLPTALIGARMTNRVYVIEDFPCDYPQFIAILVAKDEKEAKALFESQLITEIISATDRFGIPKPYTIKELIVKHPRCLILYERE